jgi:hypothetical protein
MFKRKKPEKELINLGVKIVKPYTNSVNLKVGILTFINLINFLPEQSEKSK